MKRILVVFVIAILTGTAIAATVQHLVSANDDGVKFGQRSASFDIDGVDYIVTDKATLDQIDKITKAQLELGLQQAKIGAQQARIGAQQRHAKNESERLELEKQQHALAAQQIELADQQVREQENVDKALENIFRNAVRTGVARRR